jgi:hypothetical protein
MVLSISAGLHKTFLNRFVSSVPNYRDVLSYMGTALKLRHF